MLPLLVALGGSVGAATRSVTDGEIKLRYSAWPLATLLINISGSFLLGFLTVLGPSAEMKALLVTGFCGGFTTFSTASLDAVNLARKSSWLRAATYMFGTLLICVGAVWLGGKLG